MRRASRSAPVLALLAGASCAQAPAEERSKAAGPRCEDFGSIGSATMDENGVITMDVFTLPPGPVGHGRLVYRPDSPEYQDILKHLGPIKPGQTVDVRPWC